MTALSNSPPQPPEQRMMQFVALSDTKPESIRSYKREIRAIVIDRAAYHVERALAGVKKPSQKRYDAAMTDGLAKAKLDVMAEIFVHMREASRPRSVAGWRRGKGGLVREARKPTEALAVIAAYSDVIRYIARMKA
jgi:hypothetical protein